MKKFYFLVLMGFITLFTNAQNVASFDDLILEANSFWNGSDGSGQFTSGEIVFMNDYNAAWASWSGFSYSNHTDVINPGWANQFSAIAGNGHNGSSNYATAYDAGNVKAIFKECISVSGVYVTNSTYAYLSLRDGYAYSKKFGGDLGNDPDYFKLLIYGIKQSGDTAGVVEFYLADFRSENSFLDYIVDDWTWVDLSSLGEIKELRFSLESTDVGSWGMNTPAYFCLDDLNGDQPAVPIVAEAGMENLGLADESFYNGSDQAGSFFSEGFEFKNSYNPDWFSWSGFAASRMTDTESRGYANQYSAIAGSGAGGTNSYAVSYILRSSEINFEESPLTGFYVTNSTYAYWSMKEGDAFTKKFGGIQGNEPDWFKLTVIGQNSAGDTTGTVEFYLADYRFDRSYKDYIVEDWRWVDLSSLGVVSTLKFSLSSSDNGVWGMNTPAYFCLDQLNDQDQAPVVINPIADIGYDKNPIRVFTVSLDSVFTDYDSPDESIAYKIESIGNPDLVSAMIIKEGVIGKKLSDVINVNITRQLTGESSITVSATSNGKKTEHTFKIVVRNPTNIYDFAEELEVNVYPNPFIDRINIELPISSRNITMTSLTGRVVYSKEIFGENRMEINELSGLNSGVYILNITCDGQVVSRKLIKK